MHSDLCLVLFSMALSDGLLTEEVGIYRFISTNTHSNSKHSWLVFFLKIYFLFERERERECTSRGGVGRGSERRKADLLLNGGSPMQASISGP